MLLLVLIGGGCFTERADFVSAFPWRASARWYSLAAAAAGWQSGWAMGGGIERAAGPVASAPGFLLTPG